MPVGFELAFGSLLEKAWNLGIGDPQDSPVLQEIYTQRNLKLKSCSIIHILGYNYVFYFPYSYLLTLMLCEIRIPKDILQKVPTVLLFSLEVMYRYYL